MLEARDLSVAFGPHVALASVDVAIAPGESVLVTGPSGCGKTTLARALAGLIPGAVPARLSGRVRLDGRDITAAPLAETAQQIGVVFQRPASQLFHLTVADDVAFGPRNLGLSSTEVTARTDEALALTGTSPLRDRVPASLSGGEKQLVAIAAALAMRPRVLVLDEPTASLDVASTARVAAALDRLRRDAGLTLVIVEHRLAGIWRLVDRALVLDRGRLIADGPLEDVFADRAMIRRLGLRRAAEEHESRWDDLILPEPPGPSDDVLLSLEHIDAGYGPEPVLRDIDLTLAPGEFVALVGDNGTGKSTLAAVLAGLLRPRSGRLQGGNGRRPRPGRDISLLFQDPANQLLADTVEEEICFGPRNIRRFDAEHHERILAEADLLELRGRRLATLSVGQQQRAALAAALALRPRLLVLDEPTLGQDWGTSPA